MIRYPLHPLAEALRIELTTAERGNGIEPHGLPALADRLHTDERHLRRALHHGLTDRQADRYATRIGMHPASIWPEWWDAAGDDADWYTDDPALESLRPLPLIPRTSASPPPLHRTLVAT